MTPAPFPSPMPRVAWTVSPSAGATVSLRPPRTIPRVKRKPTRYTSARRDRTGHRHGGPHRANSGIPTFTLSTNVQIASLTKVSGDNQTAQANRISPLRWLCR